MSLKDLFPGYYPPSDSDLKTLWEQGVYVFDANVLLHIYRYSPLTRDELFVSWEFVKDRIWIPYQAALEFQKNRMVVVAKRRERYRFCRDLLKKNISDLEDQLKKDFRSENEKERKGMSLQSMWDGVLSQIDFKRLADDYKKALEYLDKTEEEQGLPDKDGIVDAMRDRLDAIFAENIGTPEKREIAEQQLIIAKDRCVAKIPPGYSDENKGDGQAASDAVLWLQILEYAKMDQRPIIFVTDEEKEDWCWIPDKKDKKTVVGARPELIEEMKNVAGIQFFLCPSTRFIKEISQMRAAKERIKGKEREAREATTAAALAEAEAVQDEEIEEQNRQTEAIRNSSYSDVNNLTSNIRNLNRVTPEFADVSRRLTEPSPAMLEAMKRLTEPSPAMLAAMKSLTEPSPAMLEAMKRLTEPSPATLAAMKRLTEPSPATLAAIRSMNEIDMSAVQRAIDSINQVKRR